MNRRHLLLSTAALVVMTGASGKMAALAAESVAPAQPRLLVGRGLNDLNDVLHGAVDLPRLHEVHLTWAEFATMSSETWRTAHAMPLTAGRPFALYPADEQRQMLMEQEAMLVHLVDQRYIQIRNGGEPRLATDAHAWEDAIQDTMPRWVRV